MEFWLWTNNLEIFMVYSYINNSLPNNRNPLQSIRTSYGIPARGNVSSTFTLSSKRSKHTFSALSTRRPSTTITTTVIGLFWFSTENHNFSQVAVATHISSQPNPVHIIQYNPHLQFHIQAAQSTNPAHKCANSEEILCCVTALNRPSLCPHSPKEPW